jgi:hypothetical protein
MRLDWHFGRPLKLLAYDWSPGETVTDRPTLTLPRDGAHEAQIGLWIPRLRWHVGVGRWWGPRTAPLGRIVAAGDSVTVGGLR